MTHREIIKLVLDGERPPYVPWDLKFTVGARQKLERHFQKEELDRALGNHFVWLGNDYGFFEDIGNDQVRDAFGVVWDRSVDKDIGVVVGSKIPEPRFSGYEFPDPLDQRFFADIPAKLTARPEAFRVYAIGFSLYERAWTLRGMQSFLMDMVEHPGFVHELLGAIADYNIAQIHRALEFDIDAVYFGDDWGQQQGLIMGPKAWRQFIYPALKRMYAEVKKAGKYVMIHSCGDVDELFNDLVGIGLDCFNPFQPEVMDVEALLREYRGSLAFYGGMSTQRTLPFGTIDDVVRETEHLLSIGADGGYIFSPAHAVPGDVCLENMLAFIERVQQQPAVA
jgi:uroporphyrinogen decarboxylase